MTVIDRPGHATVLTTEEARSGETSGHVRRVLAISTILTVVALGGILGWWVLFH